MKPDIQLVEARESISKSIAILYDAIQTIDTMVGTNGVEKSLRHVNSTIDSASDILYCVSGYIDIQIKGMQESSPNAVTAAKHAGAKLEQTWRGEWSVLGMQDTPLCHATFQNEQQAAIAYCIWMSVHY